MAKLRLQHRRCIETFWTTQGAGMTFHIAGSRLAKPGAATASCLGRLRSHGLAGTSGRAAVGSRARAVQVQAALLEPPPFQPSKLRVQRLPGARLLGMNVPRRYTLTHNDVTGELQLSIGTAFNQRQVEGFYTRLLRDEITAEWDFGSGGDASNAVLRVHCHVSGEERWLAPPQLRNYIFRREMGLVLDTFMYGDAELLAAHPQLLQAHVLVHFNSHVKALDVVEYWGKLGERKSWQSMPRQLLARLNLLFFGFPAASGLPLGLGGQRQQQQVTASQAEAVIDEAMDYLQLDADSSSGSSSKGSSRDAANTSNGSSSTSSSSGAASSSSSHGAASYSSDAVRDASQWSSRSNCGSHAAAASSASTSSSNGAAAASSRGGGVNGTSRTAGGPSSASATSSSSSSSHSAPSSHLSARASNNNVGVNGTQHSSGGSHSIHGSSTSSSASRGRLSSGTQPVHKAVNDPSFPYTNMYASSALQPNGDATNPTSNTTGDALGDAADAGGDAAANGTMAAGVTGTAKTVSAALHRPRVPAISSVAAAQPAGPPILANRMEPWGREAAQQLPVASDWPRSEDAARSAVLATASSTMDLVSDAQQPAAVIGDPAHWAVLSSYGNGPSSSSSSEVLAAGDLSHAAVGRYSAASSADVLLQPKPVKVVCGSSSGGGARRP